MFFRKYKGLIVTAFINIFLIKMGISGAPVFFSQLDQKIMISVIMQIEVEHSAENDSAKKVLKYGDYKWVEFNPSIDHFTILNHFGIKNSFIEHYKRYFDPYHPSVPTPPPNLS